MRTSVNRLKFAAAALAMILPVRFAGAAPDQAAVDAALDQLNNRDEKVVEMAIGVLIPHSESLGNNAAYKGRLAGFVTSGKSGRLREMSAFALGQLHGNAADDVSVLTHALKHDTDWKVKIAAAAALGSIGIRTGEILAVLEDEEKNKKTGKTEVRRACMVALFHLEPDKARAAQYLASVLDGDDPLELKRSAAYNLAQLGPGAAIAVHPLANATHSTDEQLRQAATWALGLIGPGASSAEPELVGRLQDQDPQVRFAAALSLEHIGFHDASVTSSLTTAFEKETVLEDKTKMAEALAELASGSSSARAFFDALHSSQDRSLQQAATTGLSRVVPPQDADVQLLANIAQEEFPDVRIGAIKAIGHIHQQPAKAIPVLVKSVADPIPDVRLAAVEALGEFRSIGNSGQDAIATLTRALDDDLLRFSAARSLEHIADSLRGDPTQRQYFKLLPALESAKQKLKEIKDSYLDTYQFQDSYDSIDKAIRALASHKWMQGLSDWRSENKKTTGILIGIAVYLVWIVILHTIILSFFPLRLIGWNNFLSRLGTVKIPHLGEVALPLNEVVLLHTFQHPRVLAAWVEEHAETARVNFLNQSRRAGGLYYALPVNFDGATLGELSPQSLASKCQSPKFVVRIVGEGGSGKTTLACQIGLWAIEKESGKRLFADRRMIPVMLERGSGFDGLRDVADLNGAIKGRLRDLTNETRAIPDWLCERLLQDGRILVIIDGLSEMTEASEKPLPLDPAYTVAALVLTSRSESLWAEVSHTDIRPLRINSDHLSPFISAYVGAAVKLRDADLFEACRKLVDLVGKRSITPLLARLYAEQLAAAYSSRGRLPDNIPDLMLGYVATLNRSRKTDDPDPDTVNRAAEVAAWECCRATLSVGYAKKDQIKSAFKTVDLSGQLLDYLEVRLRLVRTVPPLNLHVEFLLDPLAEYLAGLWLVHRFRSNSDWTKFLEKVDQLSPQAGPVADFLEALHDCYCNSGSGERSPRVLESLAERIRKRKKAASSSVDTDQPITDQPITAKS